MMEIKGKDYYSHSSLAFTLLCRWIMWTMTWGLPMMGFLILLISTVWSTCYWYKTSKKLKRQIKSRDHKVHFFTSTRFSVCLKGIIDIRGRFTEGFSVVIDAVNSTGGIAVPRLLDKLGVKYTPLFCEPNGIFPHNPEPIPENLSQICNELESGNYHLGIVV